MNHTGTYGPNKPYSSFDRLPQRAGLPLAVHMYLSLHGVTGMAKFVTAEALNLIRNRKGKTPHISCVTAEPMPTRLASLAMGTGDIDCVYHMALQELISSVNSSGNEDQGEMLDTLVNGKRLRDISDLPFDLIS